MEFGRYLGPQMHPLVVVVIKGFAWYRLMSHADYSL